MKVLSFGSCNIDYVYHMDQFIRPGETKSCLSLDQNCGGKGLNQSIALAQAGANVFHAGLIGAEGAFLCEKLQSKGVDTTFVRIGEGAGGHAIIQVDENGQNCIILYGGTNQQIAPAFIDEVLSRFDAGDILVLQNEISNIPYLMEQAYAKGLRIAFNAAPYNDAVRKYPLEKVEWLIVNEVEGGGLSGESDYEKIAQKLTQLYPQAKIMLTLGKSGCIYRCGNEQLFQRACRVEAVDTTAAGDTFIGYFIRGIAENLPIPETLKLATVASAIAVTRPGAADSVPQYREVVSSALLASI
ncbi:MAG: ribokinase [Clostridia bacterium]|nr:ribokinase [Clostridia bacterium]